MNKNGSRPHEVHLRLNNEEYAALERNREKCGLTQQTYLRKMCVGIQPREQPPVDYFRVLNALRQIGINLNQIAMVAHTERWMNEELYWENVKQLESQMQDLRNQILFQERRILDE